MNQAQIKQIDQWLDGVLLPQEEAAFTEHLRNDVELQRALVRAAHLRRALREAVRDRIVLNNLNVRANTTDSSRSSRSLLARSQRPTRTRWLAPFLWAAAATLVVVIGVGRWNGRTAGLQLEVTDATVTVDGHPPVVSNARDIFVRTGSRVEVLDGSATLRTSDGSIVVLSSGARVVVGDGDQRVIDLEAGNASATVMKQRADQNFVITAPRLNARVVGTAFSLRVMEDRTRLNVSEGIVAAITGNGVERTVRAGESLVHSDDLLGWRFHSGGDDVVLLRIDRDLRHQDRPTLAVHYSPPEGEAGWDLIQRPFRVAGQKSVRIWIYIDATDERAEVSIHVVEENGESWFLSSDRLRGKPLRTWIPIDVPLKNSTKRIWKDDNLYDAAKVEYLRVVPRLGAMQLHIDISPEEQTNYTPTSP